MSLITYPLDNVQYSADDAALFHATRTSGVHAGDDFTFSVSGNDNTIMLGPGISWMNISRFKGVVAALKVEMAVDAGLPDPVYPRIDHVILQYDANRNGTNVVVKSGAASSNPQPPTRSKTGAIYENHLLRIRREPGAVAISAADVTDLRLDKNWCGLMAESVTEVDTTAINRQFQSLLLRIQEELERIKEGEAVTKETKSVVLRRTAWVDNVQVINAEGVTAVNDVLVSAAPQSFLQYGENGIRCISQGLSSLTFRCESVPDEDVSANVLILN